MATLVCFHAHPDDESIATGGLMARTVAEGHRVVLVIATRGEHGEVVPGVLDDGEQLGLRRVKETYASAEILGIQRVEFLGYVDSGMIGDPTNDDPWSFWQADLEHAANRLAAILREEDAAVLTIYDDHGGYGHPDHIQVHRVGVRAAQLAGVPRVFESTMNQDHIRKLMAEFELSFDGDGEGGDGPSIETGEGPPADVADDEFGSPEALITHAVDVSAFIDQKRRSMEAHASQIGPDSFFLKMPEPAFVASFGTEWFIEHGASRAAGQPMSTTLLP